MLKATVKGSKIIKRELEKKHKNTRSAFNTSLKVEGFGQMRTLKKEIRKGAPGGRAFKRLSEIGRRTKANQLHGREDIKKHDRVGTFGAPKKIPLRRLAMGVRYLVTQKDPIEMHIGWVGPKVSKSWKRLARQHQEGFTTRVTPAMRRFFRRALKENSRLPKNAKKFFKVRKSTEEFTAPARPIINPFWQAHHNEAWRNIRANFRRKMRGERI